MLRPTFRCPAALLVAKCRGSPKERGVAAADNVSKKPWFLVVVVMEAEDVVNGAKM